MVDKPRVGIIGDGNVGSALEVGLSRAGYPVEAIGNEPERLRAMARASDVLILAVPFGERENALREIGGESYRDKVLVDVTNALGDGMRFAVDPRRESGAEQLQRLARGARVVKAFNTVFAATMDRGELFGEPLTVFAAGDDPAARKRVLELAHDIGFDAVDAGGLENARWLETLGMLNVRLGYDVGLGSTIGFRLVHEGARGARSEGGRAQTRA